MTKKVLIITLFLIIPEIVLAQNQCRARIENREGSSGANITVEDSVTIVLRDDASRCSAIIFNIDGAGTVRCTTAPTNPTASTGFTLGAGKGIVLGPYESQREIRCIRQDAQDGIITTIETVNR